MGKMNDTNEICNKCGGQTQPIFGSGRSRWCPQCEGTGAKEKPKKKIVASSDEEDPFGFHIIELEDD